MSSSPQILMCPPDYYGIEYEINAWMNRDRPANHRLAVAQWKALRQILQDAGAQVHLLQPVEDLPDLVFTANAALVFRSSAVPARFRPVERRGEQAHGQAWLAAHGFQLLPLPDDVFFEGAGDALFFGETLVAGYRLRSDCRGQQSLGSLLSCRVLPLELVDPYFYHLDTCFCPLSADSAIYFPAAFDSYGQSVLRELVPQLIEIDREEAESFAANAVVVGRTVVTNTGCDRLHAHLRAGGYRPIATPLSEFVKAGGSAKCLTLRLDGEESATWKGDVATRAAR